MITYVVCLVNPLTQQIDHTITRVGEAIFDEDLPETPGVSYKMHSFEIDEPRMIRAREVLSTCVFAQNTIQKLSDSYFQSGLLNVASRKAGEITRERFKNGEIDRNGRPSSPQP